MTQTKKKPASTYGMLNDFSLIQTFDTRACVEGSDGNVS